MPSGQICIKHVINREDLQEPKQGGGARGLSFQIQDSFPVLRWGVEIKEMGMGMGWRGTETPSRGPSGKRQQRGRSSYSLPTSK